MPWRHYLYQAMSGELGAPIDLPAFSWKVGVSDSSLATCKDKDAGDYESDGLTVPWTEIPGADYARKRLNVATGRRGVVSLWRDVTMPPAMLGRPIVGGVIGVRNDTAQDTSFAVQSLLSVLESRYLVREGRYAAGPNHTSPDVIRFDGMSYRGIASEIGYLCTQAKPGGYMPVDWSYRGERGSRARAYEAWDIQNLSCRKLFDNLSNVLEGPDMQFRPYLTDDGTHVRYRFVAGSDAEQYLGQHVIHQLAYHPAGGTIGELTVDHLAPVMRVYSSGTGQDKAQKCAFAQDLSLVERSNDPWPLVEMTYSDSDTDTYDVLLAHARSVLKANGRPLMQIKGVVHADDADDMGNPLLPLGSYWPGELFDLHISGYAPLPDGTYRTRLMEMSGDESDRVELVFDVMEDLSV